MGGKDTPTIEKGGSDDARGTKKARFGDCKET